MDPTRSLKCHEKCTKTDIQSYVEYLHTRQYFFRVNVEIEHIIFEYEMVFKIQYIRKLSVMLLKRSDSIHLYTSLDARRLKLLMLQVVIQNN